MEINDRIWFGLQIGVPASINSPDSSAVPRLKVVPGPSLCQTGPVRRGSISVLTPPKRPASPLIQEQFVVARLFVVELMIQLTVTQIVLGTIEPVACQRVAATMFATAD